MRNIVAAKQSLGTVKDLTFIILIAGSGRRFKSIGSKALIPIDESTLINHQINIIKSRFNNVFDIITVLGFESDKVSKNLSKDIRIVENENYTQTNMSRSIALGLKAAKSDNVFIIHGDMFFGGEIFNNFSAHSSAAVDKFGKLENDKIGVVVENQQIVNFAYGLPEKWGQLSLLRDKELDLARKITYNSENNNLCSFEVLNKILQKKGKIEAVYLEKEHILKEFNNVKDIA